MKKLKFTVIVIPFMISAVLISGCAQNRNSISDIDISSVAEEKTPEELEQEKKYQEDLKNANAEKENYQYLFGNYSIKSVHYGSFSFEIIRAPLFYHQIVLVRLHFPAPGHARSG